MNALEEIHIRTLKKWQRQLQEMNAKTEGSFFSNVNYALNRLNAEIDWREKYAKQR